MRYLTSNLLCKNKIVHGFGVKDCTIKDYVNGLDVRRYKYFKTNQIHSDKVVILDKNILKKDMIEADGFITNKQGVVCFVRTADCVPILMADPEKKVVGAIHSGWRGTSKNIIGKAVELFEKEFGSFRSDIVAAIGPSIAKECYEVGEEVADSFDDEVKVRSKNNRKFFLGLVEANVKLLHEAGVRNVEALNLCTKCDSRFASYRRDRNESARQFNFIFL